MQITVIFTCFNRKDKTIRCIKSLIEGNPQIQFEFIIVDDKSRDGTVEAINDLNINAKIIVGDGNLFWAGGMRKGIEQFFNNKDKSDYVLLVNDDVVFKSNIIQPMIEQSAGKTVIIGPTTENNNYSYGGKRLHNPIRKSIYYKVLPNDENLTCDTFNCNCVLFPAKVIIKAGNFDEVYHHSLADLDYGLRLMKMGIPMESARFYIGECETNSSKGTWQDTSLTRIERLRRKESIKGSPVKEWYHFVYKNFGFVKAVRFSLTPYLKILVGK